MISIRINSNATNQMENIIKKVDTFPNRIQSMQTSALIRSENEIRRKLTRLSKASKYLTMKVMPSGTLGARFVISAPDSSSINGYWAAIVFLNGRRNYTVHSKGNRTAMKLREESVRKGYPKYLSSAKIPSMPGNKSEIKREARDIILKNIKYAAKRFGFGPRGGAAGLEEMKAPKSRSVNL